MEVLILVIMPLGFIVPERNTAFSSPAFCLLHTQFRVMRLIQEVKLITPARRIHCKSLRVKPKCRFGGGALSVGISTSMANAVTPKVANELTFSFTSAYLSIISAFSSHENCRKGAMRSSPSRKRRNNKNQAP